MTGSVWDDSASEKQRPLSGGTRRSRMKFTRALPLFAAALLSTAAPLFAFRLSDIAWPLDSTVNMQLSLGNTSVSYPLTDGSSSFEAVATDALAGWNQHLARFHFAAAGSSGGAPSNGDGRNSVFFSSTIFGDSFDSSTLAVTLRRTSSDTTINEADVIFNSARKFDSYRGGLRSTAFDFHRIAQHEFGHVLGLDHPDDAGQDLPALMNAHVSNLDSLAKDDIVGGGYLYGSTGPTPTPTPFVPGNNLINLSTRSFVGSGASQLIAGFILQGTAPTRVLLRAIGLSLADKGIANPLGDPYIELRNGAGDLLASNDDWTGNDNADAIIATGLEPPTQFESVILLDLPPGSYTAVMRDFENASGIGLVELYDLQTSDGHAANLSTRGFVQGGDSVLIGGLIVGGTAQKKLIVRAIGPTLVSKGVATPLADPTIGLFDANGTQIDFNDNWRQSAQATQIFEAGLAPADDLEAAILHTVAPGNYTAIVRSANGGTGVGLFEAFDLGAP
jgi:hypothetical protein